MPGPQNRYCTAMVIRTSTMTVAATAVASSSRKRHRRIPTTSPPIPATGSKRPMASRTAATQSRNGRVARAVDGRSARAGCANLARPMPTAPGAPELTVAGANLRARRPATCRVGLRAQPGRSTAASRRSRSDRLTASSEPHQIRESAHRYLQAVQRGAHAWRNQSGEFIGMPIGRHRCSNLGARNQCRVKVDLTDPVAW